MSASGHCNSTGPKLDSPLTVASRKPFCVIWSVLVLFFLVCWVCLLPEKKSFHFVVEDNHKSFELTHAYSSQPSGKDSIIPTALNGLANVAWSTLSQTLSPGEWSQLQPRLSSVALTN